MPVYLGVSVFGETQLLRRLERFKDRPRNLAGAYERLKSVFFGIERRQFASEGGTGSGGWAALKPATIRAKARKGQPTSILRAENNLFESLTSDTAKDWAGSYDRRSIFLGSADPVGKYHQSGTRNMPARKPVDLTGADRRALVKVFQVWLVEDDRRSVFR